MGLVLQSPGETLQPPGLSARLITVLPVTISALAHQLQNVAHCRLVIIYSSGELTSTKSLMRLIVISARHAVPFTARISKQWTEGGDVGRLT